MKKKREEKKITVYDEHYAFSFSQLMRQNEQNFGGISKKHFEHR